MPDLDNHSDDLFRKAADHYSPAPGESNWEKVHLQISGTVTGKKDNSRRRDAWLLLLLLFISGAGFLFNKYYGGNTKNITADNNNITAAKKINDITGAGKKITADIQNPSTINDKRVTAGYNSIKVIAASSTKKGGTVPQAARENYYTKGKTVSYITNAAIADETTSPANEPTVKENIIDTETPPAKNIEHTNNAASLQDITAQITEADTTAAAPDNTKKEETKKNSTDKKTAITEKKKNKARGFYFGFTGGIEFGGVKQVYFNKPGLEAGVLAGYQFNNKLAVEASLLYNKKTYFCNGSNFTMDNAGMPQNMKVVNLTGVCNSAEVPLWLVYNISNNKKSIVSISAGVSSFFNPGETNTYNTLVDGSPKKITSSYSKSSFYFASSADIALGFEKKLKNGNGLRIQPYVQLPMREVGVGKMMLTSAGVHATYIFHRKK
jgi:hypothetical protein